jgi:hypothetical protein
LNQSISTQSHIFAGKLQKEVEFPVKISIDKIGRKLKFWEKIPWQQSKKNIVLLQGPSQQRHRILGDCPSRSICATGSKMPTCGNRQQKC